MDFYPEVNLDHIHPPSGLIVTEASRFLSTNDEKRLTALLHAVLQSHEDERFAWPEVSRGNFEMKFFDTNKNISVVALNFKFSGTENVIAEYQEKHLNLVLDGDEVFDVVIRILPPEVKKPSEPGWHGLCLMKNVDLELAYATLVFLEVWRPHNKKLQACINAEKNLILDTKEYEYSTSKIWRSHIEELERCLRDALNGGIYAPAKANWGIWRIPQLYRDYCAYFKKEEEK